VQKTLCSLKTELNHASETQEHLILLTHCPQHCLPHRHPSLHVIRNK
jgi:hypothetical protein